jgi:DNA-binding NtrC family response regulator
MTLFFSKGAVDMNEPEKMVIFIVDDEETVLTSLQNILKFETDHQVHTFLSPLEALKKVDEIEIDMIISDYMMPDMDGLTYLSKVKEKQPDAIRILLTGYADKENAIKAINEIGLFQYIEKPWNNDDLLIIIRNGLEKRLLIRNLKEKIDELDKAFSDLRGIRSEILKAFV